METTTSAKYVAFDADVQKAKTRKRTGLIIGLLLCVALICAAGIAAYIISSRSNQQSSSTATSSSTSSANSVSSATQAATSYPSPAPTIPTPQDYSTYIANRMVQFCLISYCVDQGAADDVATWTCPACTEYFPQLSMATELYTDFLNYDINAFVLYDNQYYFDGVPSIVIAFAGTDPTSLTNWINNIDFVQIAYPLASDCSDCYVHQGFYETYAELRDQLWNTVKLYQAAYGEDLPVQITGHSLGGALATHCALDGVLNFGVEAQFVYTYGQPRVGNDNFANYYQSLVPITYRVTHSMDPVPHLPGQWLGTKDDFWHVATEVFYESDPSGDYVVCDGSGEDDSCSDKYIVALDVSDHLDYLGYDFTANVLNCKL